MDLSLKCTVCLVECSELVKAYERDANNVKWCFKLNSCVPEVEWHEEYLLCKSCTTNLDIACAFRTLCLQSTVVRKKQCKKFECLIKNEGNHLLGYIEDNFDDKTNEYGNNVSDGETDEDITTSKYCCKYCDNKFSNQELLASHNTDTHSLDKPYECRLCNESFKNISDWTQHKTIHLNQNIIQHSVNRNIQLKLESCRDACILRQYSTNARDVYICYHCNESHPSKVLLRSHIKTKHDVSQNKYTKQKLCTLCKNVYTSQTVFEDHLKKEHSIEGKKCRKAIQYNCLKCFKVFTKQKVMETHFVNCDGIKRHNGMQNVQMRNTDEYQNHSRKLNGNEEVLGDKTIIVNVEENSSPTTQKLPAKRGRKRLDQISNTCHICGMTFNTRYLAKRHIKNVHATEKNYECEICHQKFASPVYLNAHKRYHSRERPHICSFCGKGFITGSDLYHHEKIHANKRAYKCDKCPKAFNTSSDLHKHKLCVHQDRSEWKYVCSFCDRRFPLKTNLDAHTKTHTGERNFACHLCDRRCVNRSVLLRHIKSHSNVRLFKCNICSTEYKYQKSLDIHMTKVHGIGDAKIPERIKKYFCHICPKSYFANNKLQKHIRTHTGERPFSCQMCEKRFIDKSYVKQHLKTAHNVIFSETDII